MSISSRKGTIPRRNAREPRSSNRAQRTGRVDCWQTASSRVRHRAGCNNDILVASVGPAHRSVSLDRLSHEGQATKGTKG